MGFSESDSSKCRRHPNPKQVPGVCSSCLREKLSKLSTSPSFNRRSTTTFISNSSSFSYTPPYSSTSSAATTTVSRHRRNGSESYVSVGMVLNNGLKKSRSVSCTSLSKTNEKVSIGGKSKRFLDGEQILEEDENMKKKSAGFLKKLIHSTGKKTKGVLTHSKTMTERFHTSFVTTTAKNRN